jgi:lipid II:glycine glycyltransferase (peptidoglycan interpeptide bridge formation enzyme)
MIQFLVCRLAGRCIAGSVALLYRERIYGWYRGFDRRYARCQPNDTMVWWLFKWGVENGYRAFDFGGAGRLEVQYGPRGFKGKFGGELVNYGRYRYVGSPALLTISALGYDLVKRFV